MKRLIETALDWAMKAQAICLAIALVALWYLGRLPRDFTKYEPYESNGAQ